MVLCRNEDAPWADEFCVLSLAVSDISAAFISAEGLKVGDRNLMTVSCKLAIAQLYYHIGISSYILKYTTEIPLFLQCVLSTAVPLELYPGLKARAPKRQLPPLRGVEVLARQDFWRHPSYSVYCLAIALRPYKRNNHHICSTIGSYAFITYVKFGWYRMEITNRPILCSEPISILKTYSYLLTHKLRTIYFNSILSTAFRHAHHPELCEYCQPHVDN